MSLRGEELSGSLLGTWAHFTNGSSRLRLCWTWLRNAASSPVGGTFGGQETCDVFLKFQVRSMVPIPKSRSCLEAKGEMLMPVDSGLCTLLDSQL